jgi:hypothetical protein
MSFVFSGVHNVLRAVISLWAAGREGGDDLNDVMFSKGRATVLVTDTDSMSHCQ